MSDELKRIHQYQPLLKNLYETCKEKLGFKPDVKIVILEDEVNSNNPLGKTAYYDPANHKVGLYTQGRHIKDIMRSFSHELVHHSQNCRGDFAGGIPTVSGYAQEDGHLREMEREAYETGNLNFRDWEDKLKENDNSKLFTGRTVVGEKLMENNEGKLREVIRGLVKEMLISIKEEELEEGGTEYLSTEGCGEEPKGPDGKPAYDTPKHNEWKNCGMSKQRQYESKLEDEDIVEESDSFFPEDHDIRSIARQRTNEALMKRWGFTKKEK